MNKEPGLSLIVKVIARATVGLIMLFGIYIVSTGHITPGGGFVGGFILSLAYILLMLAYGQKTALKKLNKHAAKFFESMGALMFLTIATLGLATGYFLVNFILYKGTPFKTFSAGIIPLENIAVAFKVGAGLYAIFMALIFLKIEDGGKK